MKDRMRWIDWSRGLAIIGVLFGHAPHDGSITERGLGIWIYSFHIPLFFFISGYCHNQKDIKYYQYIKNKAMYLLVPIWVWNIIISGLSSIVSGKFDSIGSLLLKRFIGNFIELRGSVFDTSFWFISCLFLVQILTFFIINKVIKSIWHYLIIISFVIINYILHIVYGKILPWHMDIIGLAWLFYYTGYISQKNNIISKLAEIKILPFCCFLVNIFTTTINYMILKIHTDMYLQKIDNLLLYFIMSFSGIMFICILMFHLDKTKNKTLNFKALNFIGTNTFLLYILHKFLFSIFNLFCTNIFPGKSILYSIIAIVIISPICILVNKVCPLLAGKKKVLYSY
jgi:fucose 4-O-acetylase-like acetyltransferase